MSNLPLRAQILAMTKGSPDEFKAEMLRPWATMAEDVESAENHLKLLGRKLAPLEFLSLIGASLEARAAKCDVPDWLADLFLYFGFLYGPDAGWVVTNKVLYQLLERRTNQPALKARSS